MCRSHRRPATRMCVHFTVETSLQGAMPTCRILVSGQQSDGSVCEYVVLSGRSRNHSVYAGVWTPMVSSHKQIQALRSPCSSSCTHSRCSSSSSSSALFRCFRFPTFLLNEAKQTCVCTVAVLCFAPFMPDLAMCRTRRQPWARMSSTLSVGIGLPGAMPCCRTFH